MKTISIDEYNSKRITIPDEVMEQIKGIVAQFKTCDKCEKQYTKDNPEVYLNHCKNCTTEELKLTFLGQGSETSGNIIATFKDEQGRILTSIQDYESKPSENKYQTLKYYGFPRPIFRVGDRENYDFNYYGNPATDKIIEITASINYWDNSEYKTKYFHAFADKKGNLVIPNKRKKITQNLFKRAEEMTKAQEGNWYNEYQVFKNAIKIINDTGLSTIKDYE